MLKRLFDILFSATALFLFGPLILVMCLAIWIEDRKNPFYVAPRVGKDERIFKMVKMRSMRAGADRSGVDSTSASDNRITKVGKYVRKFKFDEITQLWNVFVGDMSLVGPRPNVKRETEIYTQIEKKLLSAKPGITDFASIVFSDEGDILNQCPDPDLTYNQLIRPYKSRLGIFYIEKRTFLVDLSLIFFTAVSIVSRDVALKLNVIVLEKLGASESMIKVASRKFALEAKPPPGGKHVVKRR